VRSRVSPLSQTLYLWKSGSDPHAVWAELNAGPHFTEGGCLFQQDVLDAELLQR
jgi:hypothetical protein